MSASNRQTASAFRAFTSDFEAGLCACHSDDTDHWQSELKTRDALTYAQSIIDTLRQPIIILDCALHVKTASRAFYKKFNTSPAETEGALIFDLGHGEWNIPNLRTLLEEVLPQEPSVSRELEIEQNFASLGKRVLLLVVQKLWHETGKSELTLLTLEDITERTRAEEQVENAFAEMNLQANELRRSNADLEQFALIAAHDLQSPLRTALLFTQLMERNGKHQMDSDALKCLTVVKGSIERMWALISALLIYSQVSNITEPVSEPIASEDAVRIAVVNMEAVVMETGASITHDSLPTVSVDPTHLLQLFQNLVGNALRYRSDRPPVVQISAVKRNENWIFSVCDNGVGIQSRYFRQIFEPFKRLHGEECPGSGVGLAICKKIVQRYQGEIWVESEVGHGSIFHFTLPA